jgi:isopenicillin N synthase-like dioxygenase
MSADQILDVDLLAFEQGSAEQRRAVVDGVMRSLATGFVFTRHDLSSAMLDDTYGLLADFFHLPAEAKQRYVAQGSQGQTGYTGLLVETAAVSDVPDWKEMLNWGRSVPEGHPLRIRNPYRYGPPVLPEHDFPGATERLCGLHDALVGLQTRFLRIIALGLGAHESFFDSMLVDGPHLTRAIHYPPMPDAPSGGHVWADEHGDINLVTALPRATARVLQVRTEDGWVDAVPPEDHVIINTGIMLEHLSNGLIPVGWHRVVADPDQAGERISVVQFCHPSPWTILAPMPATITAENPQRFSAIAAEDRLQQVLYEINLFETARRVEGS